MVKRRLDKREHLKVVKELTDEVPIRVRVSKTEQAYLDGVRQGRTENIQNAVQDYVRALENAAKELEQQRIDHVRGQTQLIQTFAQCIFMLGKEEGKPRRTDA
jgi:CHASE3 domain sensor protein